jgi:glycosyltransferase involved in cell wall biosynthesis
VSEGARPRVLQLIPQLFGPKGLFGGAERYALELAMAMSARVPTRLLSFGDRAARERRGALDVVTLRNQLPRHRFAGSPASLALWPHFRWADIIHCHQIYTMGSSLALLYGRARRKPVFLTDHAGGGVSLANYFNLEAAATGCLWISRFNQGQRPTRPRDAWIYAGVDAARFHPAPAPPPSSAPVLYVGRVLPVKAVHDLVAAVDDATPVDILGPAYDAAYLADLRRLARGKHVVFRPPAQGDELVQAYQQALCVVLPGVEMLPLALLEGMACGRPVIACSRSGMAEIFTDGVDALFAPPGQPRALAEKIAWIRSHPAEAAAIGQAGRRRVLAEFTWDAVADRCLAAYGWGAAAATAEGASSAHSVSPGIATRNPRLPPLI